LWCYSFTYSRAHEERSAIVATSDESKPVVKIPLTPRGPGLHKKQCPKGRAAQERLLAVLTPAERRSLVDMMVRVIAANQQYARPGAGRRRRTQESHGNPMKAG
jgi:hypothetical protein